jgi:hypothetical protein
MASGHISNNVAQTSAANGSVSVSATPAGGTLVRPTNTGRLQLFLTNTGSNAVTLSLSSSATAGQGIVLQANGSVNFQTYAGPVYGITSSGSTTVAYSEI